MIEVGAFEARTHFSKLLADVAKGEIIIITKYGQKVAMLVPIKKELTATNLAAQAINTIKTLRENVILGKGLSIKQMKLKARNEIWY